MVWSFECESVLDGARQENPLNINISFIFYCKILYLRIRVEMASGYTSTQLRQALQTTALYFDWLVKVDCEQRLEGCHPHHAHVCGGYNYYIRKHCLMIMCNTKIISSKYSKFIIFKCDVSSLRDTEHRDIIIWICSYTLYIILPKYSLFWPLERVIKCNIQNKRKFVDVRAKLFDIRAVSLSKLGINNVTKLFEDSAWDPSYPYWTGCSGSVVAKVVFAVCQYIKCSCRLEKLQQLTNFIVSCCLLVSVFWRLNIL